MKKIVALLLCLMMVCSASVVVFAADGDTYAVTVAADKAEYNREGNNVVTLTASVKDCPNSTDLSVAVTYNKEVFEIVEGKWISAGLPSGTGNFNKNAAKGSYLCTDGLSSVSDGNVFTLTLKVKENAAFGDNDVSIKIGSFSADERDGSIDAAAAANVAVKCVHNWVKDGDTVAATCGAEGYTNYKCTVCEETKKDDIVPATGNHTVGSVLNGEQVEPTCTTDGKSPYMCSVCGQKIENPIPALGHDWFELEDEYVEPTYTTAGKKVFVCTRCSEKREAVIPAKTVEVIIVVDGKEIARKDVEVFEKDGDLYIKAPVVDGYTATVEELKVVPGEDGVIAPVSIEYTPNAAATNPADDNKTPADSNNNNKPASNNPPMGDNMIFVVIALAVVACASAAVLVVRRRKTSDNHI